MSPAALPDLDALDSAALKALVLTQHEEKQRQLEELAQQRATLSERLTQHQAEIDSRTSNRSNI